MIQAWLAIKPLHLWTRALATENVSCATIGVKYLFNPSPRPPPWVYCGWKPYRLKFRFWAHLQEGFAHPSIHPGSECFASRAVPHQRALTRQHGVDPRFLACARRQCSAFPGMVPPWESSGGALKSKSGMDTRNCGISYHFRRFRRLVR